MTNAPAPPPADLRAHALDALRGLAILAMVLSGRVPFGVLPGWMYHAQEPPPAHVAVSAPGITWVDLVFPFFLFAMGVAFPFALSRKLAQGVSVGRLLWQSLVRGLLLAGFAIFIQHVNPWTLNRQPGPCEWAVGLLGFGLLFPILLRLPARWSRPVRVAVRAGGVAAAVGLLAVLHYPDGSGFRLERSNIILLVLANLAFFGSGLWLLTRANPLLRLGLAGLVLALCLTNQVPGSWNEWLWKASPAPWLYQFRFLKYLLIVLPGTVVGDRLLAWARELAAAPPGPPVRRGALAVAALLLLALVVGTTAGLYTRALLPTLALDVAGGLAVWLLLRPAADATQRLYRELFGWGAYWLALGWCFEALEGGIKKDPSTVSYYFLTTGLALFTYVALSVIIDYFGQARRFQLLIRPGQNPMLAYITANNFISPVLGLALVGPLLDAWASTPALGVLKAIFITLLVGLVVSFFTVRRVFWRT